MRARRSEAAIVAVAIMVAALSSVSSRRASATIPGMNGFFAGASANDLVLLDPQTGTKTLLLKAKYEEEGISWAPTGDRLAVISGSQLIVVEADGSDSQVLRENNCVDGPTTWSPDATQILFRECSGIMVIDADGSNPQPLTGVAMAQPEWSPDGAWLVGAGHDGDSDIWKMRPDGTDATQLTDLPGDQLSPTWSPDGSTIAFEDRAPGNEEFEISIVDASGGEVTSLTDDIVDEYAPSWSPDGSRIVFGTDLGRSFTMAVDGSDRRPVTGSRGVSNLVWQPAQVTLMPSRGTVLAGSQVRLDLRIAAAGTDQPSVLIQRSTGSDAWTDVRTVDVDAQGRASLSPKVTGTTTFRALWRGDAEHPAAKSIPAVVQARVQVSGRPFREDARSGRWYVYRAGARIWYTGRITPKLPHERLCFEMERKGDRRWRRVFYDCYQTRKGVVTIYAYNMPAGLAGRIHAVFEDTGTLLGGKAPWSYVRVTGAGRASAREGLSGSDVSRGERPGQIQTDRVYRH